MNVGVLGGGQLGRMLALAGYPLGHRFVFLDPAPEALGGPRRAHRGARRTIARALDELAARVDVVTYEFENVPVAAARRARGARAGLSRRPRALEVAQDRLRREDALPAPSASRPPPFAAVDAARRPRRAPLDRDRLARRAEDAPARLRRQGAGGAARARRRWTPRGRRSAARRCILEGFVPFARELSILAVRGRDGAIAFYPLVENHHAGGILRRRWRRRPSAAPALQATAEAYARPRRSSTSTTSACSRSSCSRSSGRLLANEMAPRVHNSGHWTIEGAETSQFENHVRAVLGLPLGSTAPVGVLGDAEPDRRLARRRGRPRGRRARTSTSTARPPGPAASSATSRS